MTRIIRPHHTTPHHTTPHHTTHKWIQTLIYICYKCAFCSSLEWRRVHYYVTLTQQAAGDLTSIDSF